MSLIPLLAATIFAGLPAFMGDPPHGRSLPAVPEGPAAGDQPQRVSAFDSRPGVPASFDEHTADSAVLIDLEQDEPLYERNADAPRAAASLTKIVAMYVVLDELERGSISIDDTVTPDPRADWRRMPAGSSLMFLREGESVSWHELLLGLAVASGNDAAYAVAYEISGSIESFAERMNDAVERAGIDGLHFTEPSGIASDNEINAAAFAEFLRHYIRRFPEAIAEYHARESVSFPKNGREPVPGAAEFRNRNRLVSEFNGADGLKTGYIRASGYNLAGSAERDGRRLVSVVLGVEGNSHNEGGRRRAEEAGDILDYGFDAFSYAELELNGSPQVRVAGADSVRVHMPPVRMLTAGGGQEPRARLHLVSELRGPISRGDPVGYVDVFLGQRQVAWQPVFAAENVPVGRGLVDRLSHTAAWWRGVPRPGSE